MASLVRPDRSVKTWWRSPIDEAAIVDPALEVFLPGATTLSDIEPGVLIPGSLPALWTGESVTVADVVEYFTGDRTVTVAHKGHDEPVAIPACPREKVQAAVEQAVERGSLCLLNGPASFQGEAVPAGVLTATATLRTPLVPLPVQRLLPDAVADAWVSGEANVLALTAELAVQRVIPFPGRCCVALSATR